VELKGGDGTDTIVLTAAAAVSLSGGVAFQDKISGFEKLSINNVLVDGTVNLDNVDDINYVINAGGAGKLTLDKMLANATVELTGVGNTIVQLADATGTADQVNVVTSAATTTVIGTVTANGVETIAINVIDTDLTSTNGVPNVSTNTLAVAADAAKTITVGGAGNLVLNLDATSKSVSLIDGSAATGKLTITTSDVDGTMVTTVKGGAAKDTLIASGSGDVLNGGAGNDTLKVVSTANSAASAVTLTGGDGVDTFDVHSFKAANAGAAVTITDLAKGEVIKFVSAPSADFVSSKVTLIAEATFNDYVTEATKAADIAADLANGGTAGVAGISWFQFNGNTFIVQDVDGNGAFTNGTDIVVKLTGLIDLSGASFNDVTAGSLKYL
jgi:S-layer protein